MNEPKIETKQVKHEWREIAKEKPIAPCLTMAWTEIGFGYSVRMIESEEHYSLGHTHWLPLPTQPKPDEAEEAWKAYYYEHQNQDMRIADAAIQAHAERAFKAAWHARGKAK